MKNNNREVIKDLMTAIENKMKELVPEMLKDEQLEWFIEWISDEVEDIRSDEEDAFFSMPESIQDSVNGEILQECISLLYDARVLADALVDEMSEEITIEEFRRRVDDIYDLLGEVVDA